MTDRSVNIGYRLEHTYLCDTACLNREQRGRREEANESCEISISNYCYLWRIECIDIGMDRLDNT